MRGLSIAIAVAVAGCFAPHPSAGSACTQLDECPAGLSCAYGICGGTDADAALVSFASSTMLVDEATGTVAISVALSAPALRPVSVDHAITGGTATRDVDFTTTDGTLLFEPGEIAKTFDLTIIADAVDEQDETIELSLASVSGGLLGSGTETVTISANLIPRIAFAAATATGAESAAGTITVSLSTPPVLPLTVDYTIAGTASTADYTLRAGTLTFAAGVTTQQLTLGVVDDVLDEDAETAIVTLANPVNGVIGAIAQHTYTIVDNDASPSVSFAVASEAVPEGAGTVSLTVNLSAASGRTVTVPFSSGGGSASNPGDYAYATTSPLSFPAGTTSKTISVQLVADTIDEPSETVVTVLDTPTNATLGGTPTNTLTITNDDHCYGTGVATVCIDGAPANPVILPATLNTDTSALCRATQPFGWAAAGQPPVCLVTATAIAMSGPLTVTGGRALVLLADDTVTISDVIDASSHRAGGTGPGAPSSQCNSFAQAPANVGNNNGAGGAAGGGFMTVGGNGGIGNGGSSAGGSAAVGSLAPALLHAGCDGQTGGTAGPNAPGAPGRGGGAVYVLAVNAIDFAFPGAILVSGAGATAGGRLAGGSGAGSGGMIQLAANAINAAGAVLIANGGGGAAGGATALSGVAGADASASIMPAAGGSSAGNGGPGGNGFASGTAATSGGFGSGGGGGGGGGGGYIHSNQPLTGATTSAGAVVP